MEPNNTLKGTKDCEELKKAFFDSMLTLADWDNLGREEIGQNLERVLEAAYRYGYMAGSDDRKNGCYKPLEAFTENITRLYLVGLDSEIS